MYRSVLALLFFSVIFSACKNNIEKVNAVTAQSNLPSETGKDVELIFSDSARIKIKLITPLIEHYIRDTSYFLFPKGVHVLFYDETGKKVKNELTSKYGIRYETLGKMEAKRDVVLINEKGEKLNTEHLIWDEQKRLIYTEAFVKITTLDEIIYGDGLESNQDFSRYKIKNIKGTLSLTEEDKAKQ